MVLLACGLEARAAVAISIDIGSATTPPGSVALVTVALRTTGAEVVGTENLIGFAPPIAIASLADGSPDCAVEPAIHKNATDFRFWPVGCTGAGCTAVRAFVLAFDNSDPIPDRSVLYRCHVQVSPDAAQGDYPLLNSRLGASDSHGTFLNAEGSDGYIAVRTSHIAIDVGDAEVVPGGDALVEIRLRSHGTAVVGTQNRIDYASPLHIATRADRAPDCVANAAINKPATSFLFLPIGCTGAQCTGVRSVVLSFENVAPIPDGVLYRCRVTVDAGAPAGSFLLHNSETAGSDAHGILLPASGRNGTISVEIDDSLVAIDVGTVRAVSGQRAMVPVRLRDLNASDGIEAAGTQNEIVFDPLAPVAAKEDGTPDCVVNPDLHKEGTDFLFLPVDCVPDVNCDRVRAFVLALDNTEPIPDGSVLYRCAVQVASDAPLGVYPLGNENGVASDSHGGPVATRNGSGAVEVICAGDCDANGQVAIFELLRGVNILLGNDFLSACQMFDADLSGDVNVNEIVQAVSSALRGCRVAQ
ncbi:MAG TPA: hypothetical protein VL049_26545 [Candidatus Dormibacteraeota bacterium]|nr:hypothetical protein [Candidatus Dormibacteraeota bacterium]